MVRVKAASPRPTHGERERGTVILDTGFSAPRPDDAVKIRRQLAALAVVISSAYVVAYLSFWLGNADGENDFFIFWSAAHWMVERGLTPSLFDLDAFHTYQQGLFDRVGPYHPFAYPPTLAPALTPLASLPPRWAFAGFMAATLAVFLVLTSGSRWRRALSLLFSPASLVVVLVGQIAFLSSGLLLGGLRLVARRPLIAGVLLGCLSFKPHLCQSASKIDP